ARWPELRRALEATGGGRAGLAGRPGGTDGTRARCRALPERHRDYVVLRHRGQRSRRGDARRCAGAVAQSSDRGAPLGPSHRFGGRLRSEATGVRARRRPTCLSVAARRRVRPAGALSRKRRAAHRCRAKRTLKLDSLLAQLRERARALVEVGGFLGPEHLRDLRELHVAVGDDVEAIAPRVADVVAADARAAPARGGDDGVGVVHHEAEVAVLAPRLDTLLEERDELVAEID